MAKKDKTTYAHFRVDTPAFFKEIAEGALSTGNFGVLKIPLNIFNNLLGQIAQRATEIKDPILDRLMFDLNLYELPSPNSKEYTKLMKQVYDKAEKQIKLEKPKLISKPC